MPELTTDNPLLQADAAGNTYRPATIFRSGSHLARVVQTDPADGLPFRAASQADVEAVEAAAAETAAALAIQPRGGNAIGSKIDTWSISVQTTRTLDYADGPLPGTRSCRLSFNMVPDNVGLNWTVPIVGRTDGGRYVFSIYAKGAGQQFVLNCTIFSAGYASFTYATSPTLTATAEWVRYSVMLDCGISNGALFDVKVRGVAGGSATLELACADVRQSDDGVPPTYADPSGTALINAVPTNRTSVAMWGDSLTAGAGGGSPRDELSRLLAGSTIYNGGVSGETSSQIRTRVLAGTQYNGYGVVVIWAGRNDFHVDADLVISNIADMVAAVPHGRVLVCSVTNQTTEVSGSPNYITIAYINNILKNKYGSKFVDVRAAWCAGSSTDAPLPERMIDATHPNAHGNGIAALAINRAIRQNGYLTSPSAPSSATEEKQDLGNTSLLTLVASLASLVAAIPAKISNPPREEDEGLPTRPINRRNVRCSFTMSGSGLLTPKMQQIGATGAGITVSQATGNLVIAAGTNANAEFLARSVTPFSGMRTLLQSTVLSNRIVNNNFEIWLADLIGEGLAFAINSATSVTVTFPGPSNPFSQFVGSQVELGAIAGAAGIPGTATVASVAGLTATFTVAGWPASGSGTLCVWGFSGVRLRYTGTTATNMIFGSRRQGYSATDVTATISTSATPGHITRCEISNESATLIDRLRASNTGAPWSSRGDLPDQLPANEEELYVFVRVLNGTANPASSTTWTLGFWDCAESSPVEVNMLMSGQLADQKPMATRAVGTTPVSMSTNTPVLASGTNTAGGFFPAPATANGSYTGGGRYIIGSGTGMVAANLNIVAAATNIGSIEYENLEAGVVYLSLANIATAFTVGTTVPNRTYKFAAGEKRAIAIPAAGLRNATGLAFLVHTDLAATPASILTVGAGGNGILNINRN